MKKIALLIPTYNEAVSIVELLQQLKSFRVLEIVDNLATAGITVSESMVLAATSTQVLDEALAYFN